MQLRELSRKSSGALKRYLTKLDGSLKEINLWHHIYTNKRIAKDGSIGSN
jgi:hypothetical protein